jgi:hypothetical protein
LTHDPVVDLATVRVRLTTLLCPHNERELQSKEFKMTDTATTVAAAPLAAFLQPILQAAVASALGVLGSWSVYLAGRYLHIQITQAAVDTVVSKAQTWAGNFIANDADNLAGRSISVSDPRIAAAANSIAEELPAILAASGWTEDRIAKLVVGEIGKLQAQTTAIPSAARASAS